MSRRTMLGFCITALFGVAACAPQAPLNSRLDASGITVVTLADAVIVARPVAEIAVAARDYAYLGPIEVNRMGERRYFLWVGLASTIDRDLVNATPEAPRQLVFVADGQPMMLELAGWDIAFDVPPYATGAPLYATLSARTTLDQIRRIAAATSVEVHLISSSGAASHYRHWQGGWPAWSLFSDAR